MTTQIEYALLAANSYAVKPSVTSDENVIPVPDGWVKLYDRIDDAAGFTARAYQNTLTGEICIAYTGTTFESFGNDIGDWLLGNITAGSGAALAPQVIDAAKFYLDTMQAHPGANITFTGHSLGGGLASLMAVYFDRPATVFDEAPFEKSADSSIVANGLKLVLEAAGYTLPDAFTGYIALDPFFGALIPSPTRVAREGNVSAIYLKDEILSLAQTTTGRIVLPLLFAWNPALFALSLNVANIAGSEQVIDANATNGNGWGVPLLNGDPINLHYMPLLTAFLQSTQFLTVCQDSPEVLQKIFTSVLNFNPSDARRNFLNLMVQRQTLNENPLGAFVGDINRIQGDLATSVLKAVLVELGIDLQYVQGLDHASGVIAGAFDSVFQPLTGGIQIEHKLEDDQWVAKGFAQLDRELRNAHPELFAMSVDRYSLATQGDFVVTAPNDGKRDLMLGGAGNDTLNGGAGNDFLLGGDGVDTLTGGAGNDMLLGGAGLDRYQYTGGANTVANGLDTLRDSDGSGAIYFDTAQLTVSTQYGDDRVHRDSSGHLYVNVDQGLIIDGNILIEGYNPNTGNHMGLTLDGPIADTAPVTTNDIIGDLSPDDIDPNTAGIQAAVDAQGNLIGTAQPYEDILIGTGAADHIISGDLNDDIGGRGGNDWIEGGSGSDYVAGESGNDLIEGGTGSDILAGGADNDRIFGGSKISVAEVIALGNLVNMNGSNATGLKGDWLSGGSGDDQLIAGADNDVLAGGGGNDLIIAGAGDDYILGDADYTPQFLTEADPRYSAGNSNWFHTSAAPFDWTATPQPDGTIQFQPITGALNPPDSGADVIYAGDGKDVAWGGAGNDVIFGEGGDDLLIGDAGNDILSGGANNDTLWGGADNDYLDGGDGADFLQGGTGDDMLGGGIGADTLLGEAGNDVLNGGDGADLLQGGDNNDILDGGSENDTLFGDAGNDILNGGSGDDTLIGGAGSDVLTGGAGNDTFVLDAGFGADHIADAGAGDTVQFNFAFDKTKIHVSLGSLKLSFDPISAGQPGDELHIDNFDPNDPLGTCAITTFKFSDQTLSLADILELGGHALDGSNAGPDISGTDNTDVIQGTDSNEHIYGLAGNDTITAGAGYDVVEGGAGNDIIDGGSGADIMKGGYGNDTYFVDNVNDVIVEAFGQTISYQARNTLGVWETRYTTVQDYETVNASVSYTLSDNLENLNLINPSTGSGQSTFDLNGTGNAQSNVINGNDGNNILTGMAGNDVLNGGAGNDVLDGGMGNDYLDGGAGADNMAGGAGNDTYTVDNINDSVSENANSGTDTVNSSVSYTLSDNIDNLYLTDPSTSSGQVAAPIDGTGNALDNVIVGNSAVNTLTGGAGNDTYIVQNTGDVIVENLNEGTDTVISTADYTLSDNAENLTLGEQASTGTGNAQDNEIIAAGSNHNYTLSGGAGNDWMRGLYGNDTLDGGSGADTMIGSYGNDTYIVDNPSTGSGQAGGDRVIEFINEGTDTVQSTISYTLGDNLENLTLTDPSTGSGRTADIDGTGNALNNIIIGNSGNNTLDGGAGSDILNGGAGADTMMGGTGNDIYYVDNAGDAVIESNLYGGTDQVYSTVTWTLGANVENLTLTDPASTSSGPSTGSGRTADINGRGNALDNVIIGNDGDNILSGNDGSDQLYGGAGNDALDGGVGSDILNGGTGADMMNGGAGNDTYTVDNLGDAVFENSPNGGYDLVISSVDFTLGANVENLILTNPTSTGSGQAQAIIGTGNALDNYIDGNDANNVLSGESGNDSLDGRVGNDLIFGGAGDDHIYGGQDGRWTWQNGPEFTNDDTLDGGDGNDFIDGGTGNDTITGGTGDDTLYGGYEGDNYEAPQFVTGNDLIDGGDGNDTIDGESGADMLLGGAGDDTIYGGNDGNPTFYDYVTGSDVAVSSDDYLDGGAGNDYLDGGTGNDTLIGGAGNDVLYGGTGNDTYVVDGAYTLVTGTVLNDCGDPVTAQHLQWNADTVIENSGAGYDIVISSASYTLTDNVEELRLTFDPIMATGNPQMYADLLTYGQDGTGNNLDNVIIGNALNNRLIGGKGNDTLQGGAGDDRYVFRRGDGADTVIDGLGHDTLYLGSDLTAADISVQRIGDDVLVSVIGTPSTGSGQATDQITLSGWFALAEGVSKIEFCNGTILDRQAIAAMLDSPLANRLLPAQVTLEDNGYAFTIPADAFVNMGSGGALTYTATLADGSPLPSWLNFDATTGTFSGTPANGDVAALNLAVMATNASGHTASSSFVLDVLNVNDAPTLVNPMPDQVVMEGLGFEFAAAGAGQAFDDADAIHGDTLTYTATLANGKALPNWLHFDAATQTFSGTPTDAISGDMYVSVTATDSSGLSATDHFTINVNGVAAINHAPTLDIPLPDRFAVNDKTFAFTIPPDTFGDADIVMGDTLTYSATMSSGAALPSWLSFDVATCTFSGVPASGDVGKLNVIVTATDIGGLSASSPLVLNVSGFNDAPLVAVPLSDLNTPEDRPFSFSVPSGTFNDANFVLGDTLIYSATMSDGSALPSWLSFDAATQTFSGTPANEDVGSLNLSVTATDAGGLAASSIFALDVLNVNDAPTVARVLTGQPAVQGQSFTFVVPGNAFGDADFIHGDTLTYSATLADSTSTGSGQTALPSWLTFDAATRTFSGTPDNAAVGYLHVSVIATDSGGLSAANNFVLNVENVNDAPLADVPMSNLTTLEDQPFSFRIPSDAFSDADFIYGDTLTYRAAMSDGSALPSWLSFDAATGTFSGVPTNWDVGALDVTVTATDTGGLSASSGFALNVLNVNDAPTAVSPLPNQAVTEGHAFSFSAMGSAAVADSFMTDETGAGAPSNSNVLYGSEGNDLIFGTGGNDTIKALAGNDNVLGGAGDDVLLGGAGDDELDASVSNDLIIGGQGSDYIAGDDGNNVILFNRGDGNDWIAPWSSGVTQKSDTVSLGGGIGYADLSFSRDGDNLILNTGPASTSSGQVRDSITFEYWFAVWGDNFKAVNNLQLITEAMAGYDQNSADTLLNQRVQQFDFVGLANQFETALAADSTITSWQLAPYLADFSLGGSDTQAIGGDMAYLYGKNGNLNGLSEADLRAQLTDAQFGISAQVLTPLTPTSTGTGTFTDVDAIHGDTLTYTATLANGKALPGWLHFDAATQTFSGTPTQAINGNMVVSVIATDTGGLTATNNFVLTVTGGLVNLAPIAMGDTFAMTDGDSAAVISQAQLLANDTDPNAGDTLNMMGFDAVTAQGNTVTQDAGGNLLFDPSTSSGQGAGNRYQYLGAGQTAQDTFTYTIADSAGATSTATVTVTINGVNDAPVAANAIAGQTTQQDAAFSFTVPVDTFTDIDQGDVLVYSATVFDPASTSSGQASTGSGQAPLPSWLTFDPVTQTFSGTPTNWDVGALSLIVTATDTGGLSASSTFALEVINVNDPPVAKADTGTAIEDGGAVTLSAATLLVNDTDPDSIHGDVLNILDVSQATSGAAVSLVNGDVQYDIGNLYQSLGAGQTATDTFSYTVSDAAGVTSTAEVTMTITGVNDAPVTTADDAAAIQEDGNIVSTGNVLANDTDVDRGTVLTVANAGVFAGSYGQLTLNADGRYTYNLDSNSLSVQSLATGQAVTETFVYQATDGLVATPSTLTVTITGTNDAPVTTVDVAAVQEDATLMATGNVLINDTDVDQGTVLGIADAGQRQGYYGQLTLLADGSYTYALDNASLAVQSLAEGQTATETFVYQATDGLVSTPSTLTVTITGTNDAPVTTVDVAAVQEDLGIIVTGSVLANDTDVDQGAVLTVANAGVFAGQYGQLTLAADGTYGYALDNTFLSVQSLAAGQVVTETFDYQVADGMIATPSTLTVTITGTNDVPVVAIPLSNQTATETGTFTYQLPSNAFTDIDQGDKLTYTAALSNGAVLPTWLNFDATNQTFSSTLPDGAAGLWDITVTATDTMGASAASIFNLDVANLTKGSCEEDNLTGTQLRNIMYGLGEDDKLSGDNADDVLVGGSGNDVLEGGAGNDTLIGGVPSGAILAGAPVVVEQCCEEHDHPGNNLFNGGAGNDTLIGANGNDLLIGGTGNDLIDTGAGADIIAFNRGDGQDTVLASTSLSVLSGIEGAGQDGADNTLSLGGGIKLGDLTFSHMGNDLILETGAAEQITLRDWYASLDNHSIANLQIISNVISSGTCDKPDNKTVRQFDFGKLVASFDQAVAKNSTTDHWALANALLDKHLEQPGDGVLGGDLAWQYGMNGTLSAVSLNAAQDVLGDSSFGVNPQQVHKLSGVKDGVAMLG